VRAADLALHLLLVLAPPPVRRQLHGLRWRNIDIDIDHPRWRSVAAGSKADDAFTGGVPPRWLVSNGVGVGSGLSG
jgi:hypothetical protein